jgi:hypothetical protein
MNMFPDLIFGSGPRPPLSSPPQALIFLGLLAVLAFLLKRMIRDWFIRPFWQAKEPPGWRADLDLRPFQARPQNAIHKADDGISERP